MMFNGNFSEMLFRLTWCRRWEMPWPWTCWNKLLHLPHLLDSDQLTFGFALQQGTFFLCGLHRWTNVIHEKGSSWGVSPYYPSCWMLTSACQGPPLKRLQVPQENWSMSVHVLPIAIMLSGFIWFYHAIWYMVLSFLSICSPLLRCHPFFPMVHSVHSLRISPIIPIPQRKIAHAHGEGRRGKTCQNGRDRRPAASAQLIGPDGQFTNGIWMESCKIL